MLLSARIIRQPSGAYQVFCVWPDRNERRWFPTLDAALGWLSEPR